MAAHAVGSGRSPSSQRSLDDSTRFRELIQPLEQPCQYGGRRVRALRPFQADDYALLVSVNRGEFAINGFRNRDLQRLLYAGSGPDAPPLAPKERRRRSAAISRKLRMLRAHGPIRKLPKPTAIKSHQPAALRSARFSA
jgi:hypothetical protein